MSPPNAARTARERARAELTREIKEEAHHQGWTQLLLRRVDA